MLTSVANNPGLSRASCFSEIVGNSPALTWVLERVQTVASTRATVLILGETGVGKELIGRAIHRCSERSDQPWVAVNCASIPEQLFESEFFGHVRGAFTGAGRDRKGRFERANGGTLFLDEVAEIPLSLQGKLLRVLQEGDLEAVGDDRSRHVDVRVIAATNRDLEKEVTDGKFREDLFYRLNVFPLQVPTLAERREDIVPLARHFVRRACESFGRTPLSFGQRQIDLLCAYAWPGNVRELQNIIERAVILSPGRHLNLEPAMPSEPNGPDEGTLLQVAGSDGFIDDAKWQQLYRSNVIAALNVANWRVSGNGGAADLLGIRPSTLRDRMRSMVINNPGRRIVANEQR